jgi:hypothetical protein
MGLLVENLDILSVLDLLRGQFLYRLVLHLLGAQAEGVKVANWGKI